MNKPLDFTKGGSELTMKGFFYGDVKEKIAPHIKEYTMSEKLDGYRVMFIPQTVGKKIRLSEYAVCSGFWSSSFTPMAVPVFMTQMALSFSNRFCLDGEFWSGRGLFNLTSSVLRKKIPVEKEWDNIKYKVFDRMTLTEVLTPRRKKVRGEYVEIRHEDIDEIMTLMEDTTTIPLNRYNHEETYRFLKSRYFAWREAFPQYRKMLSIVKQHSVISEEDITSFFDETLSSGGEGVMLRHMKTAWTPKRCLASVKIKPSKDEQGVVIGFVEGKGRLTGVIGSLIIEMSNGVVFNLSGMPDELRSGFFSVGDVVEYAYTEITPKGVPRFGRFLRRLSEASTSGRGSQEIQI
jgi:ATP-dependent DNA ligase